MNYSRRIQTTGFSLKIIAVSTMIIDHIGAVLFPQFVIFRIIGRLAFPIYCFLLAEGFSHTRNIKKYGTRLFLFALISEVPFDLAFNQTFFYWDSQNVFWTLFIGLQTIYFAKRSKNELYSILILIIGMVAAMLLKTDYTAVGILMIYVFSKFKENKKIISVSMLVLNGIIYPGIQLFAMLSLVPIYFYEGKPGMKKGKWLFYVIYPLHLILLALLKTTKLAFYL